MDLTTKFEIVGRIFILLSYLTESSADKRWELLEKIEGILDDLVEK